MDPVETQPSSENSPDSTVVPKSHYVRFTTTLHPDIYRRLLEIVSERKIRKEKNPVVSAVINEALAEHFKINIGLLPEYSGPEDERGE